MSNKPLVYVVKEGDRYIETTQGFEFKYNGSSNHGAYTVHFNGGPLDPVSRGFGYCKPIEDGRYLVKGPKGEELGEFDSLPAVCEALVPYTYALHYGKS